MVVVILPGKARFLLSRRPGVTLLVHGWWELFQEVWHGIRVWNDAGMAVEEFDPARHAQAWLGALGRRTVARLKVLGLDEAEARRRVKAALDEAKEEVSRGVDL